MPRLIEPSDDIFETESRTDGDWAFDARGTTIFIVLPPHNRLAGLPISQDRAVADGSPSPVWWWDGNREAPTLEPSILSLDTGWHGYLRAGKLESV